MPTKANAFCNWTFVHEVWCVIIIPNAVHLKKKKQKNKLAIRFFPYNMVFFRGVPINKAT